jgi:hypothetical protein
MNKKYILIGAAVLLLMLSAQQALAQSPAGKIEVGAQFTLLKVNASGDQNGPFAIFNDVEDTLAGGGIRIGYNLTSHLSVEAEGNIFKRPSEVDGRRSQGLFGVKYGKRGEKLGVFAKFRPGFMRFDHTFGFVRESSINLDTRTNIYLAMDAGGVVEVYPTRRSIIRFDFGDTIVRYTNRHIKGFETGAIPILKANTTSNFQFGVGFGFRF